ncbi:WD and tetratricopeptide repeats protein 1 [Fopius arisanus]|uniref:WD and tetratricopeptide repeats protein 1 n=2 Tax=Fopius arisanus TaxID=64838 RepID=A0A9R1U1Z2_9HYME|nr:PREDICTED: WD and tetratricopeptide repeats protein 1-like [Fopius arisanus]
MESSFRRIDREKRLIELLRLRETHESLSRTVSRKLHVADSLISRLGLEKELEGHKGCVNCLEWNSTGEILASASDDMHLILWDPFRYQKKLIYHTGHNGNIFSVKFMPESNDSLLVTGAGDNGVRVHDVSISDTILVCTCHTGRVKRIATLENVPSVFWSAGEDGLILQYDMRTKHNCKSINRKSVLINLVNHAGRKAEAKCMAVNKRRPELLAIGANDPYVRLYDRRMIKLGQIPIDAAPRHNDLSRSNQKFESDDNLPIGCAQYFIAGHLKSPNVRYSERNFATTYLTFSDDGNELLVNMGGEQIYLFDIDSHKTVASYETLPLDNTSSNCDNNDDEEVTRLAYGLDGDSEIDVKLVNTLELPLDVETMKQEANCAFQNGQYTYAVNLYNRAIEICPTAAVLHANRAATYMKRRWDGDIYAALRDCQTTLHLDPDHVKAHFRLARCLNDLHRPSEAFRVIQDFQRKYPEYDSNVAHKALKKDIKDAMASQSDNGTVSSYNINQTSYFENEWRARAVDYKLRFCGHCNTTTDIKEANFFGSNGQYIVAGSDDGSFFVWNRKTTNILRVLRGDERIVNCLQPHPSTCLLATSGIDPVIRLWSPLPEDGTVNDREVEKIYEAASANQIRMNSDPFELMIMSMGYRFPNQSPMNSGDEQNDSSPLHHPPGCRTS